MSYGYITYWAYDMNLNSDPTSPLLLAELPLTGVSFSSRLNTPGSFSGTLNLNDPKVNAFVPFTTPGRTWLFVDMDGIILWGGILWTRSYDNQSNLLQLSGSEGWSYFQQRIQAQDYALYPQQDAGQASSSGATFWTTNPELTYIQAAQVVSDASGATGNQISGSYLVPTPFHGWYRNNGGASSLHNGAINMWVTGTDTVPVQVSFPKQQRQTVDSIMTSLVQSGYTVGFDYMIDWSWSAGPGSKPIPTMNLHFPLRTRATSVTGFGIDTSGGIPYTWPEDATQMADQVYGQATGAGGFEYINNMPASTAAGWPVLEVVNVYSNLNDQQSLVGAVNDDLSISQLPVITPTFTLPLIGTAVQVDVRSVLMGDDVAIFVDPDPRFPNGLHTTLRITGTDFTIADEGLSTVEYTCTIPPDLVGPDEPGPGWLDVLPGSDGSGPVYPPSPAGHHPSGGGGDGSPLISLPSHSLTLVRWSLYMPTPLSGLSVEPDVSLQMYPYVENQTAGFALGLGVSSFQISTAGEVLLDSDALPDGEDLPYRWVGSSNVGPIEGRLVFLSWSNILGSDDTLIAWAVYHSTNATASGVTWTASTPTSGFAYMGA